MHKRMIGGCVALMICLGSAQVAFPSNVVESFVQSDERLVTGVVVDKDGGELPGVRIEVKGSKRGGISNYDGTFSMKVSPNEKVLIFSYIGYKTVEVDITKDTKFRVVMEDDTQLLEELVVTGYQSISKERVTGSFAVINTDELKTRRQTDILGQLEGQVPGLVQKDGMIAIRGLATLKGQSAPLFVVDGMPFEGNIKSINPSTITKVTVLKDAAATSIYGARAANGVIVISTINGSTDGRVHITYDGNVRFTPKPNYKSLNLMNTSELIDLQVETFHLNQQTWQPDLTYTTNPIIDLLLQHREGLMTDAQLKTKLDAYKALDNRSQLVDFYLQTGILHQHNMGLSGGTDAHKYYVSIDYMGDRGTNKYANNNRLGFTVKNTMKFLPWLSGDISVVGAYDTRKAMIGGGSFSSMLRNLPSYMMLKNADGSSAFIPQSKSELELKRLVSIGLLDEHFSPIENLKEENNLYKSQYYRINTGLNFNLMEGLDLEVRLQTENSSYKQQKNYSPESYTVRNMVNDAAEYDSETGEIKYNVPMGGQMDEARGDTHSWTIRPQLKFDKAFGKHSITALAGTEWRAIKETSTRTYYMGYDPYTLAYTPIDPYKLADLYPTQALWNQFTWDFGEHNYVYESEDRFVSFYANGSYTFDNRLNVTGSIRIDQSNLFGTDPRYQYRPLWSLGASYDLSREDFLSNLKWIDQLKVRMTYGVGGNIPKTAGPYLMLSSPSLNVKLNALGSRIVSPPNPTLRWERTDTFNAGVDFAFFGSRLTGSLDVYNKYTQDLLANRSADPTLGWKQMLMNYGTMRNTGVELSLAFAAINKDNFSWNVMYNFGYNKNRLLTVDESNKEVFYYTEGDTYTVGYPAASVFSFRYAGLNPENGLPLYYTKDNQKVEQVTDLEDLVYSGTTIPPFTASLTNSLSYKGFDLSFMFSHYAGHVFRYDPAPYYGFGPSVNVNRSILDRWKAPGDELKDNVGPAIAGGSLNMYTDTHQWYAADKHVLRGDYISLRTMALSYTMDRSRIAVLPVQKMTLTLQAENLFIIPLNKLHINPEAMSISGYGWGTRTFAPTPVVTLGASVSF